MSGVRLIDYHQNANVRRYEVAFGALFSNIPLARVNADGSVSRLIDAVPIENVGGDKYYNRLRAQEEDGGGIETKFHETFPRMTYRMASLEYDSDRKVQGTPWRPLIAHEGRSQRVTQAEPWKLGFEMHIITKNKADAWGIAEQIMLMFVPHFTMVLNGFPEPGQHTDVPIFMEGVEFEDDYDGPIADSTRTVVVSFTFRLNAIFFGSIGTKLEYDVLRKLDGPDAKSAAEYPLIKRKIINVFGSAIAFENDGEPDVVIDLEKPL